MRRLTVIVAAAVATGAAGNGAFRHSTAPQAVTPLIGRWDFTVQTPAGNRPSWLEVRPSGRRALVGRFVGFVGSARPISTIAQDGDHFRFAIPPQWEAGDSDEVVEGQLQGDHLTGTLTLGDGRRFNWTAVRAPLLRHAVPTWGTSTPLLGASGLAGWHIVGGENQWRVTGGVLANQKAGGNLVTDRTFGDFKLHVEFRYPKGSNSGVYLRGRYEVQVEDSVSPQPENDMVGGVYGFIAPSVISAKPPGEWQSYDIVLVGRMVTVIFNGTTVISNREIPGITGGALDADEGAPGPLMLQGDHGPIEYRNIVVTPAR